MQLEKIFGWIAGLAGLSFGIMTWYLFMQNAVPPEMLFQSLSKTKTTLITFTALVGIIGTCLINKKNHLAISLMFLAGAVQIISLSTSGGFFVADPVIEILGSLFIAAAISLWIKNKKTPLNENLGKKQALNNHGISVMLTLTIGITNLLLLPFAEANGNTILNLLWLNIIGIAGVFFILSRRIITVILLLIAAFGIHAISNNISLLHEPLFAIKSVILASNALPYLIAALLALDKKRIYSIKNA